MRLKIRKSTAANERFHASGGVCPQTVLWVFGSLSPARTFVPPRLHKAATTLAASEERTVRKAKFDKHLGQRGGKTLAKP